MTEFKVGDKVRYTGTPRLGVDNVTTGTVVLPNDPGYRERFNAGAVVVVEFPGVSHFAADGVGRFLFQNNSAASWNTSSLEVVHDDLTVLTGERWREGDLVSFDVTVEYGGEWCSVGCKRFSFEQLMAAAASVSAPIDPTFDGLRITSAGFAAHFEKVPVRDVDTYYVLVLGPVTINRDELREHASEIKHYRTAPVKKYDFKAGEVWDVVIGDTHFAFYVNTPNEATALQMNGTGFESSSWATSRLQEKECVRIFSRD